MKRSQVPDEAIRNYLKQAGHEEDIDREYSLRIKMIWSGETVTVKAKGMQTGNDVIEKLKKDRHLDPGRSYVFLNWPEIRWGRYCFVCELETTELQLNLYAEPEEEPAVCYYGCPRAGKVYDGEGILQKVEEIRFV